MIDWLLNWKYYLPSGIMPVRWQDYKNEMWGRFFLGTCVQAGLQVHSNKKSLCVCMCVCVPHMWCWRTYCIYNANTVTQGSPMGGQNTCPISQMVHDNVLKNQEPYRAQLCPYDHRLWSLYTRLFRRRVHYRSFPKRTHRQHQEMSIKAFNMYNMKQAVLCRWQEHGLSGHL